MKILVKEFTASQSIYHYDEYTLKLVVYGTAYVTYLHDYKNDYQIGLIYENFIKNPKSETITLFVKIELLPIEKDYTPC